MVAHVANDGPGPLEATLRVALYRDGEVRVDQASLAIELGPHSVCAYDLEQIVGHFADIGFAYRFGPPGHDVVAVSLERASERGTDLIANAFRFPVARPSLGQSAAALGLEASIVGHEGGETILRLRCRRLVRDVCLDAPGWLADDQAFTLEPGVERSIVLRPAAVARQQPPAVTVSALNLRDPLRVAAVFD
jgi:beta-mannosidase